MIELPQQTPDLVIRVPLPHANITEQDLGTTKNDFSKDGLILSMRAEEVYPVSGSWAEIAIVSSSFLAGTAANHYAEKLFDALDRFLKKELDQISLGFSKKQKTIYKTVPRKERLAAITQIAEGLNELEADDINSPQA